MARETLTKAQIVETAIGLLDDEGLEGMNMRALGVRLDSAATAVYWHVGSKANLISLAGDSIWNEVALPDLMAVGWREAARMMAIDLQAMFVRHPWVVQAFGTYLVFGPTRARHDEHSLAIFETAGFEADDADRASAAVFTFVLASSLGSAAAASMRRKLARTDESRVEFEQTMTRAREIVVAFPRLVARMNSPAAAYAASAEATFEFGLGAILDGLESRLSSYTGAESK